MVVPEDTETVREVLSRALAGEGTSEFEFTVSTADGRLRDMLFNATTQRDAAGRVVGVYGVGQVRVGCVDGVHLASDAMLYLVRLTNASQES
jgi:hypothetical protein